MLSCLKTLTPTPWWLNARARKNLLSLNNGAKSREFQLGNERVHSDDLKKSSMYIYTIGSIFFRKWEDLSNSITFWGYNWINHLSLLYETEEECYNVRYTQRQQTRLSYLVFLFSIRSTL